MGGPTRRGSAVEVAMVAVCNENVESSRPRRVEQQRSLSFLVLGGSHNLFSPAAPAPAATTRLVPPPPRLYTASGMFHGQQLAVRRQLDTPTSCFPSPPPVPSSSPLTNPALPRSPPFCRSHHGCLAPRLPVVALCGCADWALRRRPAPEHVVRVPLPARPLPCALFPFLVFAPTASTRVTHAISISQRQP